MKKRVFLSELARHGANKAGFIPHHHQTLSTGRCPRALFLLGDGIPLLYMNMIPPLETDSTIAILLPRARRSLILQQPSFTPLSSFAELRPG